MYTINSKQPRKTTKWDVTANNPKMEIKINHKNIQSKRRLKKE